MKTMTTWFVINMVIVFCVIVIVCLVHPPHWGNVCGRIRTGDIRADLMTDHEADCVCCPVLWNGGIVSTAEDLSSVKLYDMADVRTLDGGHYVLECVEIIPCIRVGKYLIGWRGVIKANGDVLVYSAGKAYRFTML